MTREVDERILDAAQLVFLERGYRGASQDEIAAAARASKATLYRRFGNKEALFIAVIERNIDQAFGGGWSGGCNTSPQRRLVAIGVELLSRLLTAEAVSFMRIVIAEAARFPDLARRTHEMAHRHSVEMMACALFEAPGLGGTQFPRDEQGRSRDELAQLFLDLVVLPLQFRALMGMDLERLRDESPAYVRQAVRLFMALDRRRAPPKASPQCLA